MAKKQHLDFYLPDYNVAIECQGIQHFEPVEYFGGDSKFKKQIENDIKKREKCKKNGVKLLYYSSLKEVVDNKNVLDKEHLLKEIKNAKTKNNN